MSVRTLLVSILTVASAVSPALCSTPTIVLKSTRSAALNDGRDFHELIAEVRNSTGGYVTDGTIVTFSTTLGQFQGANRVATRAGSARIRLTCLQKGTSNITAAVAGGGFQTGAVTFTDDPAETFQGNAFMVIVGTAATAYHPGIRIIEARGRVAGADADGLPGASLVYRNIQVFADRIQVDCNSNMLRASGNVRVVKGGRRLDAARLSLPLMSGDGYAVLAQGSLLKPVKLKGSDLSVEPQPNGVPPQYFEMPDVSEHPQVVVARQIRLFPGEKLQFNRPRFYQEGQQVFAVPFYSMGLFSNALITEQVVNVGSQGIGLDFPYYYDLSPGTTGIFFVRHGEQSGRSSFATRPGWSLDLVQGYNSSGAARRFNGEFNITGMNKSDWGVRWNHSHELDANTMSSVFLDVPQHRALYGQANFSRQFPGFRLMANVSGNRSLSGISANGSQSEISVGTTPRRVAKTGYTMSVNADVSTLRTQTAGYKNSLMSQGMNAQFMSPSYRLGSQTSLTNYVTLGNVWANNGAGGANATSNLTLLHAFGPSASLQMGYDFQRLPLDLYGAGNHKINTMLRLSGASKWDYFLYGTAMLDTTNTTFVSDLNYNIAPRWRVTFSSTLQQFATASYRDFAFGVARSIGGRDVVVSYSTYNHRFFFDLQASRF